MNALPAIAAIATFSIFGSLFAGAQSPPGEAESDPVLDAIREFNQRDGRKPNEVTVVLDPVGQPLTPPDALPADPKPADAPKPVLVTGKPPEGIETDQPATPPEPAAAAPVEEPEEPKKPEPGLAVRVEKLHTGNGVIDPTQVKLRAPFPAKPLAQPPAGWKLDASASAPHLTREVELEPGSKITLTIRPHLLIPAADGANTFTVTEPGYDTDLGYQQTSTLGAILSNSIRQLDEDSQHLGTAIDNLQQLLSSLPKPELQPEPPPEPQPVTKPAIPRKR